MGIIEAIVAILGSSALTGIVTAIFSRRKSKAEAVLVETQSQIDLAKAAMDYADRIEKNFRESIDCLSREIATLKAENVVLRQRIDVLITENTSLRIEIGKFANK